MSVLPQRERRRTVFMLTPLVDIMFLLLIFFMLTTQTSPYRMILLSPSAIEGAAPAAPSQSSQQGAEMVVSISHLLVSVNGEQMPATELAEAISRYRDMGFDSAVAIPTPIATVQDIVAVLEAFEAHQFETLRLVSPVANP